MQTCQYCEFWVVSTGRCKNQGWPTDKDNTCNEFRSHEIAKGNTEKKECSGSCENCSCPENASDYTEFDQDPDGNWIMDEITRLMGRGTASSIVVTADDMRREEKLEQAKQILGEII